MDIATLLGLIGACAVIAAAIVTGGSAGIFLNVPSLLIVVCGSLLVVLIKFNLMQSLGAFKVATRAFANRLQSREGLIAELIQMSEVSRREGLLALQDQVSDNQFLQRGIGLLVDGVSTEEIRAMLERDMRETADRHNWGAKVFSALGDVAPAMGMIGTLIGLVQMLSAMDDPKQIGPAMAVALLTTLYGAVIANVIALPIADKLKLRRTEEAKLSSICIDGVLAVGEGYNTRMLEGMLKAYLAPSRRELPDNQDAEVSELKQAA